MPISINDAHTELPHRDFDMCVIDKKRRDNHSFSNSALLRLAHLAPCAYIKNTQRAKEGFIRRIGYIRTSRDGQLTDRQIRGLRPHCDELWIEEGVSATRKHRPVYRAMTEALQPGDMLVVWSLGRAFRSTIDALPELKKLDERGIEFHSVTQNSDTSTPAASVSAVRPSANPTALPLRVLSISPGVSWIRQRLRWE